MSFGRRLALFFVLIVLVPTLALVGMLVIVSKDSRQGKEDAALAAGLDTALALYEQRSLAAEPQARRLASDPALGSGLRSGDAADLRAFADRAVQEPGVAGVEVLGPADTTEAAAGSGDAVAFAELGLRDGGSRRGKLLVSVTTADQYAADLRRLTGRDVVVRVDDADVASTAEVTESGLEAGETGEVSVGDEERRAHLLSLDQDRGETALVLGPRSDESLLAIERPAALLLAAFLLLAIGLAWVLARALTGLHSQVAQQAVTDPLTGLYNRRRMNELMAREVERAQRFGHELSVMIVDADDFKQINDRYGHQVGDAVLETVADVARMTTRSIDVCARYGGDEMAIMLIETGAGGASVLADRLRDHVRTAEVDGLGRGDLTVSVGVSTLPDCANDLETLIGTADQALLVAKRAGKDQTRIAPGRPRSERNGHGRPDRARGSRRRGAAG